MKAGEKGDNMKKGLKITLIVCGALAALALLFCIGVSIFLRFLDSSIQGTHERQRQMYDLFYKKESILISEDGNFYIWSEKAENCDIKFCDQVREHRHICARFRNSEGKWVHGTATVGSGAHLTLYALKDDGKWSELICYCSKRITDSELHFSVLEGRKGNADEYALVFPKKITFFSYKLSEKINFLPFERD